MNENSIKVLEKELDRLELNLEKEYQLLGKKTQEYMEEQSKGINALVEEIIEIKKEIQFLEDEVGENREVVTH